MLPADLPHVTFVLPTLDEAGRLASCLGSIRAQSYPQERVTIMVADGGSTDGTVEIARRFGCHLIDADGLLAEAAKERALRSLDDDCQLVAMIDADNTLIGTGWLRTVVGALERYPNALGFESFYQLAPDDPPLNRYLTGLLQISDPWARAVARRPRLVEQLDDGLQVLELPSDGAYPTGANGFVFRCHLIDDLGAGPFHEATFFPQLIRAGQRILLKHPEAQVHHAYVAGWRDFQRKKQRVAMHYLLRREETVGQWDAALPLSRRLLAMAYCVSLIGPAVEGAKNAVRDCRPEWLLHPLASSVAVVATILGIAKSIGSRERRRRASRRLKPGRP